MSAEPSLTFPPALNVGRSGPRWPARCAAVPRAAHPARLLNQSMTLHIIAPICLPPYFDGAAPYAGVPTGRDDRDGIFTSKYGNKLKTRVSPIGFTEVEIRYPLARYSRLLFLALRRLGS